MNTLPGRIGRLLPAAAIPALILAVGGCDSHSAPASRKQSRQETPYKPIASIKELMDSTVDPAADGVWDAVGVISDASGVTRHEPHTDEEWHEVRRHAMTLIESMNTLMIPGRPAAPHGTKGGLGELTPEQIDAAIKANRPEFDLFASAVLDSSVEALKAIDNKDKAALTRIGGDIDERCEACHLTFWYPDSARPDE
ncbi:MAG: hypothetical protein P8Y48_14575 [Novosphingobium sp.]